MEEVVDDELEVATAPPEKTDCPFSVIEQAHCVESCKLVAKFGVVCVDGQGKKIPPVGSRGRCRIINNDGLLLLLLFMWNVVVVTILIVIAVAVVGRKGFWFGIGDRNRSRF